MNLKEIIPPCRNHPTATVFAGPGGKTIYCSSTSCPSNTMSKQNSFLEALFLWYQWNTQKSFPCKNTFTLKRLKKFANISALVESYLREAVQESQIKVTPLGISFARLIIHQNLKDKGITNRKTRKHGL